MSSLPVPLTVRIRSATSDRHVTRELSDLSFSRGVPGGFKSISMQLKRPIDVMQADLLAYAHVWVYDGRTRKVMCEGQLEDPGRSANADGQVWSLTAIGPSGHARNRKTSYIVVDRALDRFERFATSRGATLDVADDPGGSDEDALVLQFPDGLHLVTNIQVSGRYKAIQSAGQKLAAFNYIWDAGSTSGVVAIQGVTRQDAGGGTLARSETLNAAGGAQSIRTVVSDFSNGHNLLDMRLIYTGTGTTIGNDLIWASLMNLYVRSLLLTKAGVERTTGYNVDVVASEVVSDLLGRFLDQYDGANASVATNSFAITQLAYLEASTPAEILDDLMLLEPLYFWEALESDPVTGLYRFNWRAWPTSVRYEASVAGGFDAPSSVADLYNRVTVTWVGPRGRPRLTVRTQAVPILDDLGITREERLDLGTGRGSASQAQQVGDGFLANHKYPANRGTLVVSQPIKDNLTGQTVDPWEIEPGYLIRVRGVESYPDALNASDRDGVTVFRIVDQDFSASDAAATLALDAPARSIGWQLGTLQRRAEARP